MIVGILKENQQENRVSALPEIAANLIKLQAEVWVESQAGSRAFAQDQDYIKVNAQVKGRAEILSGADLVLTIHLLNDDELRQLKPSAVLLGVYQPLFSFAKMKEWAAKGLTTFSLDMIPRTTRAQSMDVLSSQASVAGYKAVVLAASNFSRYFPMLTTSAGSIPPAKVLVLGAGVAGLQAIATAKRLGAVVEVFDTRPAAKEEVMSLGAKFIEVEGAADASKAGGYAVEQTEEYKAKQKQRISDAIAKADIVISTAQIPGKKAPVLITKEMVERMKGGAMIVDLAASTGGNCELTQNNTITTHNNVSIVGNSNLPSSVPADASKMYGKNILNFLKLIIDDKGGLNLNFEDDLVKGTCITYNGQIVNDRVKQLAEG